MNLTEYVKRAEKFTVDNSPLILTAIGVTGTLTTTVLVSRVSFKVGLDVNAGHYEPIMEGREPEVYDFKGLVRTYWKEYIPPAGLAVITVASIICANRIGTRRAAAMAAAYTISERAFEEYREKIVEKIGDKKERDARDEIAQERVDRSPIGKTEVIITGGGDVLCFDAYTGRYFYSNMETLKKAQNDVNYSILNNAYASLNDFYNNVGLANIEVGEEVGWNYSDQLELIFSTTLSDDQRPCISISFQVMPIRDYYKFH